VSSGKLWHDLVQQFEGFVSAKIMARLTEILARFRIKFIIVPLYEFKLWRNLPGSETLYKSFWPICCERTCRISWK